MAALRVPLASSAAMRAGAMSHVSADGEDIVPRGRRRTGRGGEALCYCRSVSSCPAASRAGSHAPVVITASLLAAASMRPCRNTAPDERRASLIDLYTVYHRRGPRGDHADLDGPPQRRTLNAPQPLARRRGCVYAPYYSLATHVEKGSPCAWSQPRKASYDPPDEATAASSSPTRSRL